MRDECSGIQARSGREAEEGDDDLSPFVVGNADHSDLGYVSMFEQHILDFRWKQILAAADDHLLNPARHPDIAAPIHRAEIAGVEPSIRIDSSSGRLR